MSSGSEEKRNAQPKVKNGRFISEGLEYCYDSTNRCFHAMFQSQYSTSRTAVRARTQADFAKQSLLGQHKEEEHDDDDNDGGGGGGGGDCGLTMQSLCADCALTAQ